MPFHVDLHLHSHFSRATSGNLNLEHLSKWAQLKGIQVVGTGDFVHPAWLRELQDKLEPAEEGLFTLKPESARVTQGEVPAACQGPVRFLLTVEISNIYKRLGKVRKVHNIVFVPSFEAAERLQARLEAIGNLRADGRPILGLDSRDLLEIVLDTDPLAFLIPAHIWTPWFSALGSKGGFDRMDECFGDLTPHIFAVETGLSSDPPMNWRLSQLDPYVVVSNSDAHSPQKLGRETTMFETDCSYPGLYRALSDPDDPGLVGTVEFFPEEGKYHYDGHRACGARLHPRDTIAHHGLCPVCGKPVTVGVMARVEALADRPEGEKPPRWRPYYSVIPLPEVIGAVYHVGPESNTVQTLFQKMLAQLGSELRILLDAPLEDIRAVGGPLIAEGLRRMRSGEVEIQPGYDGTYGVIGLLSSTERSAVSGQTSLLEEEVGVAPLTPGPSPTAGRGGTTGQRLPPLSLPTVGEKGGRGDSEGETRPSDISLLSNLNAAQRQAVTRTGGHVLIVAGPGTGKTHTLTSRIAYLVHHGVPSQQILAVTFTNKAAEEMRERLVQWLGDEAHQITVGTFHSVCLAILRRWAALTDLPAAFTLATPDEIEQVARHLWPDRSAAQRRDRLDAIARWKATGQTEGSPDEVAHSTRLLRARGLLDFDDVIVETLSLLRANPTVARELRTTCRFVFVDEYQDINAAQHALLKTFVQDGVLLTAIGDPNQAIYGFRGAEARFFASFPADFPSAVTLSLSENYRSAADLLIASAQVIRKTSLPDVPPLVAVLSRKGRLTIHEAETDKAEAEYVVHQVEQVVGGTSLFSHDSGRVASEVEAERSFGDIAVLSRLNSQQALLEEAFHRSGIPYQVSGDKPLIAHPAVFEIMTFLRLSHGAAVAPEAARRLLAFVVDGIGDKTAAECEALWRKTTPSVSVEHIRLLLRQSTFLSDRARRGLQRWLQGIDAVAGRLRSAGISAALEHLSTLPDWQAVFAADPAAEERLHRLIRVARWQTDVEQYLDHVLLHRDTDPFGTDAERVSLLTLHAAKGLEFPVVFIVGCEQHLLPLQLQDLRSDPEEERRLFYVGMTRAKEQLYFVRARRRSLFGKTSHTAPSPFLADIEEQLKHYEEAVPPGRPRAPKEQTHQLKLFEDG